MKTVRGGPTGGPISFECRAKRGTSGSSFFELFSAACGVKKKAKKSEMAVASTAGGPDEKSDESKRYGGSELKTACVALSEKTLRCCIAADVLFAREALHDSVTFSVTTGPVR